MLGIRRTFQTTKGTIMNRSTTLMAGAISAALLALAVLAPWLAVAQDAQTQYSRMASLDLYLMDRSDEIALARSAAPPSISGHAQVLVLGRHGYETAANGTNGFLCIVERSWTASFDDPEFFSPALRYPICFNAPAVRSHLPLTLKRTELALAGRSKTEMFNDLKAAFDKKELPLPERGAMCFMMSKQAYFGSSYGHFLPHLMFYFPQTADTVWGGTLPGSPVMVHQDHPDPVTVLVIPVGKWSDGTPVPVDTH
jgi:hypothetical protein